LFRIDFQKNKGIIIL